MMNAAWRRLSLLYALLLCAASPAAAQQVQLAFLDVGQGDAVLLLTPERKTMLVDAGRNGTVVARYLHALGIDTLDFLVASHNHDDHIGGFPDVLAEIPIRSYMDNGVPTTRTYRLYEQFILPSGARYLQAESRTIRLGSVQVRVLPPPDRRLRLRRTEQNNRSVGLLIQYGQWRALLTGDAQEEELGYWLRVDSVPPVTVLKVNHHGSRNGTTPGWLARTQPRVAVISVGHNSYGHPSPAVIAAWCAAGAFVFRPDQNGSIVIRADTTGHGVVEALPDVAGAAVSPTSACGGGP